MSGPKLSKWEQKQLAAKQAAAKFEANQARAAKRKGMDALDAVGDQLGQDIVAGSSTGVLGWAVAHRKLLVGILVVLLGGGAIFTFCMVTRYRLRTVPGQPRGEVFVAGSPGTLIVLDHVAVGGSDSRGQPQQTTAEGQRLTAIDAATGRELAVEVDEYKQCWASSPHLVCVDKYDRVSFLDPRTLAVTRSAAELIEAAKLAKPSRRFEREGDAVVVVLEDGRGARIDSALEVTVLESVQPSFPRPESSRCATVNGFEQGAITWLLRGGGTRVTLTSDPPPPSESATPSGPALTFLGGGFLETEPPQPLILHAATTEKPSRLVSRFEGFSKEVWRRDLGGECRRAWIAGPHLIVATGDPAQRGLALDLATGAVVWTFGR